MSAFLQLAFILSVILLAAKMAGYLSVRLGQPAVLGELLVGILLGPSLLDLLHLPFLMHALAGTIAEFGELGVLLLMFLAGLELHFDEMRQNLRVAMLAGFLGVIWPVLLGWGAGLLFGLRQNSALFLGLMLGATSVSISAQTLMELKALRSRVGLGLLGAAVFDDILVILLLSVFLAFQTGGASSGIFFILLRMALFLGFSMLFGLYALPWLLFKMSRLPISQGLLTLSLVVLLLYGVAAEVLGGMAAITGAFLAGLMLARCSEKERVEMGMRALAYGLFVPIFFVNIGLSINLRDFRWEALALTLVIIVVAAVGKWLGAGWGARLGGLSLSEAVKLGAGMISRGEVGLIVADVGIREGLISQNEFSAVVVMVLATTLITPPILRFLFAQEKARTEEMSALAASAQPQAEADPKEEAN